MESLISSENFKCEDPERIKSTGVLLYNEYDKVPSSMTTIGNRLVYVRECIAELFQILTKSTKVVIPIPKRSGTDAEYSPLIRMLSDSSKIEITKVVMNDNFKCTVFLNSWTRDAIFVIKDKMVVEYFTQETNTLGL